MELHTRAIQLAKDLVKKESELLEVLMQMKKENSFAKLGYRGVFDYVLNALKLSEAQAFYYQKVAGKALEVPALKEAVTSGAISVSKARRIAPIINQADCEEWIDTASTLGQKELEKAVAEINPAARVKEQVKPVGPKLIQMTIAITPEVEALLKRVKELESQRTKKDASWNDVMKVQAEAYLHKNDPVQRAERLSLRKPEVKNPKPGRHPIAAQVIHQVNLRDGNQCVEKRPDGSRCKERQWLDFDHVVPVFSGGLNTLENIRTLCTFHHRLRHSQPTLGI